MADFSNIQFPNLADILANSEKIKEARGANQRNQYVLEEAQKKRATAGRMAPLVNEGNLQGASDVAAQEGDLEQVQAMQGAQAAQVTGQQSQEKERLKRILEMGEYMAPSLHEIAQHTDQRERSALVQTLVGGVSQQMEALNPGWSEQVLNQIGDGDKGRLAVAAAAGLKVNDQLRNALEERKQDFAEGPQFGLEQAKFGEEQAQNQQQNQFREQELAQQGQHYQAQDAAEAQKAVGAQMPNMLQLRNQYEKLPEVATYKAILPIVQSVRESEVRDTKAADLNIIYGLAKVMDPQSVVRESESAMVAAAGSPAEQYIGLFNSIVGGGRLSAAQRKELLTEFNSRFKGAEDSFRAATGAYQGITQRALSGQQPQIEDVITPPMQLQPMWGAPDQNTGAQPQQQSASPPQFDQQKLIYTAKKYGMTPEQLIAEIQKKLGAQ